MFTYLNKKGQSTLEYGLIIAVIVGALIAMQVYIKRGIQGKLKQASDDIGEQFSPGAGTYNYTTFSNTQSNESVVPTTVNSTQMSKTTTNVTQSQTRTANEQIGNLTDTGEDWGQ